MKALTKNLIKALLKPRAANTHKGSFGHSLLIAGSKNYMGAAVISAKACLRAGTGLLTVNIPKKERLVLQVALPESIVSIRTKGIDVEKFSCIGIGPGIGIGKTSTHVLNHVLHQFKGAMVLDADALNIVAKNPPMLSSIKEGTILTPHPKEFDRLFGTHNTIEERIQAAITKAKSLNLVIVLKGHQTLVTYKGEVFINTTGNAGLAKGGSGDALTGIITALLAQGYEPFSAAKIAVYLHGLAADIALKNESMESLLITDVIACLSMAFKTTMQ